MDQESRYHHSGDILGWLFDLDLQKPDPVPVEIPPRIRGLDEATLLLPPGVYTTFRTYPGNKVLQLNQHLERLRQSASLAGMKIELDEQVLRSLLRKVILFPNGERLLRVRMVISSTQNRTLCYVLLSPFIALSKEIYAKGVRVISLHYQREMPEAKLTTFIRQTFKLRRMKPDDVDELLLIDAAGNIQEGLSSNFFAIKGKELYTAGVGVLKGITRQLVIETADQLSIPINCQTLNVRELPLMTEAFISSSSRGILPVVKIDEFTIRDGLPGSQTHQLINKFNNIVHTLLEPL